MLQHWNMCHDVFVVEKDVAAVIYNNNFNKILIPNNNIIIFQIKFYKNNILVVSRIKKKRTRVKIQLLNILFKDFKFGRILSSA
jgi:hypothetical protein